VLNIAQTASFIGFWTNLAEQIIIIIILGKIIA